MNYQSHYDRLIDKARSRIDVLEYSEKHHVVPKSLGGSNAKSNIVALTGREHFLAHMLLAKIYGKGLWQAARMMQNKSKVQGRNLFNSRLYEMAKREWVKYLSDKPRPQHVGEAIRKARLGSKASEETKLKMSEIRKGKPRSGDPSKWKHTDAAKEKMKQSQRKRENHMKLTEHRERMKGDQNPMKSDEARKKISEAKKLYWKLKNNFGEINGQ